MFTLQHLLLLLTLTLFFISSLTTIHAQTEATCNAFSFPGNKLFTSCQNLPALNSHLHWNYNPKTATVDLAYRQPMLSTARRWASWAINPTSQGMVGAQSLVAFQGSDGVIRAYTSPINSYRTRLQRGNLSFPVYDVSAILQNSEMIIFAKIELPNNNTKVNHLWQEGPLSGGGDTPGIHPTSGANLNSMGTIDFLPRNTVVPPSGGGGGGGAAPALKRPRQTPKNVHGLLSSVTWGILIPVGVGIARYLKAFKPSSPLWFYVHSSCQTLAYVGGLAGLITGLKLGADSPGIQYNLHRNIGISLSCLATLQVFALIMRPNPDHKYRFYWTIYHQVTGYIVVVLSIFNVFKGLDILEPEKIWKEAYIGFLAFFGVGALVLEAWTWIVVIQRKRADKLKQSGANLSSII